MGIVFSLLWSDNAHASLVLRHDYERDLLLSGSIMVKEWSSVMLMFCAIISARQENTKAYLMMPGQLLDIRGYLLFFSAAHCVSSRCKHFLFAALAVITGLRQHLSYFQSKVVCFPLGYQVICKMTFCHHSNNYFCIVVLLKHAYKLFSNQVAGVYSPFPSIWANHCALLVSNRM